MSALTVEEYLGADRYFEAQHNHGPKVAVFPASKVVANAPTAAVEVASDRAGFSDRGLKVAVVAFFTMTAFSLIALVGTVIGDAVAAATPIAQQAKEPAYSWAGDHWELPFEG
ncbi:MAG: hypothetical protein LBU38_06930 [Propionibacteriaceae bacterium]|jgi:hypothetical protein|nr:hypothetical protein [Propionibacteriaceae bacterium]